MAFDDLFRLLRVFKHTKGATPLCEVEVVRYCRAREAHGGRDLAFTVAHGTAPASVEAEAVSHIAAGLFI